MLAALLATAVLAAAVGWSRAWRLEARLADAAADRAALSARVDELEQGQPLGGPDAGGPDQQAQPPPADGVDLASCAVPQPGVMGPFVDLAEPPDDVVDEIAEQVAAARDLAFDGDVDVALLDRAALRARVGEAVAEDYTPAAADRDARLLGALGAVPDRTDMRALAGGLLGDQVTGFYDPASGELVVGADAALDAVAAVTVAHELDHALTDDALKLPDVAAPSYDGDPDAVLATQALVEGDATMLMQQWASRHLTLTQQLNLSADPASAAAADALADVPPYLVLELEFPYLAGFEFACRAYLVGGWDEVDAVWREPPTTTAQVLDPSHPGRVRDPLVVEAPGGEWEPTGPSTFGAAQLSWLLAAPGGEVSRAVAADVDDVVDAWGGGEARVWTRGDDTLATLALVDSGRGAAPLCTLLRRAWASPAFADGVGPDDVDGPDDVNGADDAGADDEGADDVTVHATPGEVAAVGCGGPAGSDVVVAVAPDADAATAAARQATG